MFDKDNTRQVNNDFKKLSSIPLSNDFTRIWTYESKESCSGKLKKVLAIW